MIWRAGMLAVCVLVVEDGRTGLGAATGHKNPTKGGIYRVEAVVCDHVGNAGLVLEGHHSAHPLKAYLASAFRPLNDAKDDASLIARIKRCKPARKPVEA